jgi:hypothetical protein
MRLLFSIFLIIVFISKMVYGVFIQIHFYANQKEITAIECENLDRPEMNCNGKCFLSKQLAQVDADLKDKKTQQDHRISITKLLETGLLYCHQLDLTISANATSLEKTPNWNSIFHLNSSFFGSIDHPPSLLS